jgi:hypothetical protein
MRRPATASHGLAGCFRCLHDGIRIAVINYDYELGGKVVLPALVQFAGLPILPAVW